MNHKLESETNLTKPSRDSIIINIPTTITSSIATPTIASDTIIPTTFSTSSTSTSALSLTQSSSSSYDTDSSVNSMTCCSTQHDYRIYLEKPLSQTTSNNRKYSINCNNGLSKATDVKGENCTKKQNQYRNWPIFILLISVIEISVFIYDVITVPGETLNSPSAINNNLVLPSSSSSSSSSSAIAITVSSVSSSSAIVDNDGLKSFQNMPVSIPTDSVFIYRPDRRLEVWRFISYMFLHANWFHLGFNVIIQLFFGVPLEIMHGPLRIAVIYFAGVFAGSLGTSVVDSEVYLVGASGGVYALLAAHIANIIFNYRQMKFAVAQLVSVVIFVLCDLGYALYTQYLVVDDDLNNDYATPAVSYIAHLTGALAGLSIGLLVLKSIERHSYDNLIWWAALSTYCAFTVFAIVFNLINTITAQLLEEQGEVITQHLLQELGVS